EVAAADLGVGGRGTTGIGDSLLVDIGLDPVGNHQFGTDGQGGIGVSHLIAAIVDDVFNGDFICAGNAVEGVTRRNRVERAVDGQNREAVARSNEVGVDFQARIGPLNGFRL